MKSQVDKVLHVAEGLLLDCLRAYPALKDGFTKDLGRLALACRNRGLVVFLQDLPNLDSLLIQGLETGRLCLNGHLTRKVSKEVRVPRLFSGLWLRVFDSDACLKQDADVTSIAFLRQLCCLGKKIEVECSRDRQLAVLENYHAVERELRHPTLSWDSDSLDVGSNTDRHLGDCVGDARENDLFFDRKVEEGSCFTGIRRLLDQVQQVADLVNDAIDPYEPDYQSAVWERESTGIGFKHGPGAVSERLKGHLKSVFPNWPDKLQSCFPFELIGSTMTSMVERPVNHEPPSRLICVPKTFKGPRLIASEPTAHQYCQQGTRRFMVEQLRKIFGSSFVDFHDQGKSAKMVLHASLHRSHATVDLTDASDRLTCWVVERVFRRNPTLLRALHSSRTRWMIDNISHPSIFLKPRKFASQGTAVTFPVQSFVFLCIAIGACIDGDVTWDKINKLRGWVRVYGDDIIIPTHGYERLCRIMDHLQLKVNRSKSFVLGKFRESCGTDGYCGYDVTPVKPKRFTANGPEACQALIDTSNNFHVKGFWHAAERLDSLIPKSVKQNLRVIDVKLQGFSGLASFAGTDESHLKSRWNSDLQREEVRSWNISPCIRKSSRDGYHVLLEFFSKPWNPTIPRVVSVWTDIRRVRHGPRWETSALSAAAAEGRPIREFSKAA